MQGMGGAGGGSRSGSSRWRKRHLTRAIILAGVFAVPVDSRAGEGALSLTLIVSEGYLPGIPVLARVEVRGLDGSPARDVWNGEALLAAAGFSLSPDRVTLRNGLGSALVSISGGTGDALIEASLGDLSASRLVRSLDGVPSTSVSGSVAGPLTEWGGVVHVTGALTVPAGATLRVLAGTLVLVDGVLTGEGQPGECQSPASTPSKCGTSITVRGTIESLGTEEAPVTFTAANPLRAWGQIHHEDASPSLYRHTFMTRAGNSPRGGHTNTGSAVKATRSAVRFESSAIADTAGKSVDASGSSLEFIDTLLTRSVMGPEVGGTAVLFERSYAMEFHGTDDNDGIYLHDQSPGQDITLRRSVFASGDDDGIDTLGSNVLIEDCIVRDWRSDTDDDTKGISLFSGETTIRGCIVADNHVGISAKGQSSGATVHIDRTTVARGRIGIQAQDKFGEPDLRIRIFIDNTICRADDSIRTEYPQFPDDIQIRFSDLGETWTGPGNITGDPLLAAPAAGDFRLLPGSPCIDAGDPAGAPDPDGTRADMGALPYLASGGAGFTRGRVNEDDVIDLADAVALLLHLFAGRDIGCRDAADSNDDGLVDLTDAIYLLDHLFRGGPPLAPPAAGCGLDPTADDLDCAAPEC